MPNDPASAIAEEQQAVDAMYVRRDELLIRAQRDLEQTRYAPTAGTPGARAERSAFNAHFVERIAALEAAEERLCFGRLDSRGGDYVHIGRLSLSDNDQVPILIDWRAPAAEPFYQATALDPRGVIRRRHIVTTARTVTSVEDDVLDLDAVGDLEGGVHGGGVLMAALAGQRTGRMRDIVSTIQGEQDRIIRSPLGGVLVVEGGPGCGKTVVALHRAAYLLFTHRERIARSGVLVVGPNRLFLQYIGQVLPALGETSAVLVTPGQLFPGVDAEAEDSAAATRLKGDLRMAAVLARAVRERQRQIDGPRRLNVHGTVIELTPRMVADGIERARATRKPHNGARLTFVTTVLEHLVRALGRARRLDPETNRDRLEADLRDSADVRREVNLCWMPLSPERVLSGLFASPEYLARCAGSMPREEQRALRRDRGAPWTVADVPLLDELAEILGADEEISRREEAIKEAELRIEEAYVKKAAGFGERTVTASDLIEHYSGPARLADVADRASQDRSWEYGHIVIDEAQELSPMAWRVIMRRCPSRSLTVVGDLHQTGSAAGVTDWSQVFDRYAPDNWRKERLTVNYRTPRPVMECAVEEARAHGMDVPLDATAREGRDPELLAAPGDVPAAVLGVVSGHVADPSVGRIAVIVPRAQHDVLEGLVRERFEGQVGAGDTALDRKVSVLTATGVKGLEFDVAVVVNPEAIRAESPMGVRDLYVAMTRPTQHLVMVTDS